MTGRNVFHTSPRLEWYKKGLLGTIRKKNSLMEKETWVFLACGRYKCGGKWETIFLAGHSIVGKKCDK